MRLSLAKGAPPRGKGTGLGGSSAELRYSPRGAQGARKGAPLLEGAEKAVTTQNGLREPVAAVIPSLGDA